MDPTTVKGKKKKKKKKKKRCAIEGCRCRLKLTDMKCRCDSIFCAIHRYPEIHQCSWNPKSESELSKYKQAAGLDCAIVVAKMERI